MEPAAVRRVDEGTAVNPGRSDAGAMLRDWRKTKGVRPGCLAPWQPQEHGLLAACYAMLLAEGVGASDGATPAERARWGGYLRSFQRVEDGSFVDVPAGAQPPATSDAAESALTTYLAVQALDALGLQALHALSFVDELAGPGALREWLDGVDWSAGRRQADRLMAGLFGLIHTAETRGSAWAPPVFHGALDWLEGVQDPKSGLWGLPACPLAEAIAVSSRLIPFYDYVHRPIQRFGRIIDTVLDIAGPGGDLVGGAGPGADADLAAVSILATLTGQTKYRRGDIQRALLATYRVVRGGDADAGIAAAPHGDGARPAETVADPTEEVRQLWLRALTLATIERLYPEALPSERAWRFRRWPALGYHRPAQPTADHDGKTWKLWMRPTACRVPATVTGPPAVSVIIPCYNDGRYLHESVESVLAQTLRAFEVIIVDDGSTDEFTRLLLSHLDRPRTRVIHQRNRGASAARNEGIRRSAGRYICCLDADDRLRPEFLEKAAAVLDAQPDVGLVSSQYELFDERDALFAADGCALPEMLESDQAMCSSLFRREAWEKAGGYCETSLKEGLEDWDLWISILELGYRAVVLPEVLFEYRVRPDSRYHTIQPETMGCLVGELVRRHQASYKKYVVDVMAGTTVHFARLLDWSEERGRTIEWWHRQSANWQRLAREREGRIEELRAWVGELEQGKAWLEEQQTSWRQLAEEREGIIRELRAWVGELEQGKAWLEEQRTSWQRAAEERGRLLQAEQEKRLGIWPRLAAASRQFRDGRRGSG
jgi:glycosyltransferase involved in cell wall biosynthesis/exonuclease VII small subunit